MTHQEQPVLTHSPSWPGFGLHLSPPDRINFLWWTNATRTPGV